MNSLEQKDGKNSGADMQLPLHKHSSQRGILAMKPCSYCGKDNPDDALSCRECGTPFNASGGAPVGEKPRSVGSGPSFNSAELANVLIKILGLWACLQGIPSFVGGFLRGLLSEVGGLSRAPGRPDYSWTYAAGSLVYFLIGIFLIARSRYIARKLFKNGDA
jgi:hypothetical protein